MIDSIIQLQAAGITTTTNDIAAIDIPEDGEIMAIAGFISDVTIVLAESIAVEVSFLSVTQLGSNDARGVIFGMVLSASAAAPVNGGVNSNMVFPEGIPVKAGERIHLHTVVTGATNFNTNVILYMSVKGGARRVSARR